MNSVRRENQMRAGALALTIIQLDGTLEAVTISRAGDQRDEGAGFIRLDADQARTLAHWLLTYGEDLR